MPMKRATMSPTPVTWAVRYVNEQTMAPTTPTIRAAFPPYRAARKSGIV